MEEALSDTPVVLLTGARQCGKTTLLKTTLVQGEKTRAGANSLNSTYLNLDDAVLLGAARSEPRAFLENALRQGNTQGKGAHQENSAQAPLIIDEVQRAPELFPALKMLVDEARGRGETVAGRFLLTGSANPLLVPRLSESLAGRMEILRLQPLAQCEIEAGDQGQNTVRPASASFVDECFDDGAWARRFHTGLSLPCERDDILERIVRGGFPEILTRKTAARRRAWFDAYLTTLLERDVRDLSAVENLAALPRLLTLLSSRAANLLNLADVARGVGVPHSTLQRYLGLLEATFLVRLLPAWHRETSKRLLKAPKVLLGETALGAHLLKADAKRLADDAFLLGSLLENFGCTELLKLASWSETAPSAFHLRTAKDQEVDLVLEGAGGEVVGFEFKASTGVSSDDFKGLKVLRELSEPRWKRGVVLYGGTRAVPFGDRLWALPISTLWA